MTFETDKELNYDIKTRIISDNAAFGPGVARIMTLVKETNSLSRAYESMGLSSFEDLTDENIERIAIGDPSNVPVGQYSEEIFSNLNIKDAIDSKLILANDVRTVLTWVESGEVDCGIVYATDAFTSEKVKIITEAPAGSHKEVTYPAAVVKSSQHADSAKAFIDFLSTDEAKNIFEKYGFVVK
jgi:molybdate transport system substrate-binding protein